MAITLKHWIKIYAFGVLIGCTLNLLLQLILAILWSGDVLVHFNHYHEMYLELVMVTLGLISACYLVYDALKRDVI
jgi:hypothetical protein